MTIQINSLYNQAHKVSQSYFAFKLLFHILKTLLRKFAITMLTPYIHENDKNKMIYECNKRYKYHSSNAELIYNQTREQSVSLH